MSSAVATTAALEASYKSALLSLSQILHFYRSVDALSVAPYARHAPRAFTSQLQLAAGNFDSVCAELETRVLKAVATLERDLLKATGQPIPSDEVAQPLAALGRAPGLELGGPSAAPTMDIDLSTSKDDYSMDMDDSFLHTSLFGDSTVTSPVAMDAAPTTSLPSTSFGPATTSIAPATETDFSTLIASLSAAPSSGPISSGAPLSMPLDAAALPLETAGVGNDAELNAMLSMLSGSGMAAGITAPSASANLTGLEGLGGQDINLGMAGLNFDFSGSGGPEGGEYGEMDAGSLDELLKSLGGGT